MEEAEAEFWNITSNETVANLTTASPPTTAKVGIHVTRGFVYTLDWHLFTFYITDGMDDALLASAVLGPAFWKHDWRLHRGQPHCSLDCNRLVNQSKKRKQRQSLLDSLKACA